ncbi:MAG: type II secretion system F family protein [Planctomycetota bacterium]
MPDFRYRAVDAEGEVFEGVLHALDAAEAERLLEERQLKVVRLEPRRTLRHLRLFRGRVSRRDLVVFTRNLAVLYRSGVPLLEGLNDIADDTRSPELARLAQVIRKHLSEGATLSQAFERCPRTFNPMYVAAVHAGEATGSLDSVLTRLADHLEWKISIRAMVAQAFIYPIVVACALLGLIILLLTYLMPAIVGVFLRAGVVLPLPTRILIGISDFLIRHGVGLAGLAIVSVLILISVLRTRRGRRIIHGLLLKLPGLGAIAAKSASAQFAATLRTLHHAGSPMTESLAISCDAVTNAAMAHAFHRAALRVEKGEPLSTVLRESKAVQPLVSRMVSVGERSGQLEESLGQVVEFYDREVPRSVKRVLSALEPSMTIVAGCIVAFVVFCCVLPLFRLMQAIKGGG